MAHHSQTTFQYLDRHFDVAFSEYSEAVEVVSHMRVTQIFERVHDVLLRQFQGLLEFTFHVAFLSAIPRPSRRWMQRSQTRVHQLSRSTSLGLLPRARCCASELHGLVSILEGTLVGIVGGHSDRHDERADGECRQPDYGEPELAVVVHYFSSAEVEFLFGLAISSSICLSRSFG